MPLSEPPSLSHNFYYQMSLSKGKFWYSKTCLLFSKCAVPLIYRGGNTHPHPPLLFNSDLAASATKGGQGSGKNVSLEKFVEEAQDEKLRRGLRRFRRPDGHHRQRPGPNVINLFSSVICEFL
jgi:hypothetical protein